MASHGKSLWEISCLWRELTYPFPWRWSLCSCFYGCSWWKMWRNYQSRFNPSKSKMPSVIAALCSISTPRVERSHVIVNSSMVCWRSGMERAATQTMMAMRGIYMNSTKQPGRPWRSMCCQEWRGIHCLHTFWESCFEIARVKCSQLETGRSCKVLWVRGQWTI